MAGLGSAAAALPAATSPSQSRLRLVPAQQLAPQDQDRWNELSVQSQEACPFARPWFLRPSLSHCDPDGEAVLAIVEDENEAWLGTMPLRKSQRYGRLPLPHWEAWHHPNMFSGAQLIRAGSERCFWEGLLRGLDDLIGVRPALRLTDLPRDSAATEALLRLCADQDRPLKLDRERSRAMLGQGDGHYADQLQLNPDARRRTSSLARKLADAHGLLAFSYHRDVASIPELVERFLALEQAGWKGRAQSALACSADNAAFFRAVTSAAGAAGTVEFALLHAGSRLVAMSVHFIDKAGWSHGFKTTFDEQAADCGPGVHLLIRLSEHFRQQGLVPFDSCSAPEQLPIGKLWPDRREFIDIGVALGSAAGRSAFRALAFCEDLARRQRAATNAKT